MRRALSLSVVLFALPLALTAVGANSPARALAASRSFRAVVPGRRQAGKVPPGSYLAPAAAPVLTTVASLAGDEREFVRLVNEERARRGLCQLTIDPTLTAAARQHSKEMADRGYFDHYSPVSGLRSPLDRYAVSLGTRKFTCVVGENLFYSSQRDVALGHRSLMKSPGHRANILAGDYRAIGVGVYLAPNGEYYATQMFHS